MFKGRQLLTYARAAALAGLLILVVRIAPTLASHAAGHSTTYSAPAAAAAPRTH